VEKPEGEVKLGRPRWEDNIKMVLKDVTYYVM
jgi:hypothetical protein